MSTKEAWYIVKQDNGQCAILPESQWLVEPKGTGEPWGPYASQQEAIARRIGLIRSGKCQPA